MLTTIELVNYRGHVKTEVPVGAFTLLVGDNGVGKTSVLRAVELAGRAAQSVEEAIRLEGGVEKLLSSNASGSGSIRLAGQGWSFKLDLPRTGAPRCGWGPQGEEPDSPPAPVPEAVRGLFDATVLALRAEALAAPSLSDKVVPRMERDGSGLATALLYLGAADRDALERCELALRKVVPTVRKLSIGPREVERTVVELLEISGQQVRVPKTSRAIANELLLQFEGTQPLPASSASEGTLLSLGILAYLESPTCPRLVLLDDLERGLHPRAQAELVGALRSVVRQRPDVQILATTHSPYLVDLFEPSEVVVLGRPMGGPVVAKRLSEHPDQRLLKTLTTGEFLAASGPGWFDP